ncbi:MAG: hypothetical protein Q9198_011138, partial [Flavoplaca austrocitrina]
MALDLESHSPINGDSLTQLGLSHFKPSANEQTTGLANQLEVMDISQLLNGDKLPNTETSKDDFRQLSSREVHEKWFENQHVNHVPGITAALALLTLDRRRCIDGYLFDCIKNMIIVGDDRWLKELWEWIGRARRLADDESFIVRGIDLNYLGVFNIWNIDLGPEKAARISGKSENTEILYAVEAICRSLNLPALSHVESSLPAHRCFCLYICDFDLSGQDMRNTVANVADGGHITRAAFLAL